MKQQIALLLLLFFLLSLAWEVPHSYLYDWNKAPLENNVQDYIPRVLKATVGDFIFLSLIFIAIALLNKNPIWINKPSKSDYTLIIISGIIIAILIEIRGLAEPRWAYNELMPTIFGIGLTPLIQLVITFLLALWITNLQP
jgi:hypothetical protein